MRGSDMAPSTLPTTADALHQKLNARTAHVGIVGLGYVGLPLAVEMARAGFKTTGIDLDPRKVEAIMRGESYIPDVQTRDVAEFRQAGRLVATTDPAMPTMAATAIIVNPASPSAGRPASAIAVGPYATTSATVSVPKTLTATRM